MLPTLGLNFGFISKLLDDLQCNIEPFPSKIQIILIMLKRLVAVMLFRLDIQFYLKQF